MRHFAFAIIALTSGGAGIGAPRDALCAESFDFRMLAKRGSSGRVFEWSKTAIDLAR
ncbi:MAG: hypothetical protein ABIW82_03605 [Dokdonella sp.]